MYIMIRGANSCDPYLHTRVCTSSHQQRTKNLTTRKSQPKRLLMSLRAAAAPHNNNSDVVIVTIATIATTAAAPPPPATNNTDGPRAAKVAATDFLIAQSRQNAMTAKVNLLQSATHERGGCRQPLGRRGRQGRTPSQWYQWYAASRSVCATVKEPPQQGTTRLHAHNTATAR
jgi:hypothetical protein